MITDIVAGRYDAGIRVGNGVSGHAMACNLTTLEVKAFVAARDFALSKQFIKISASNSRGPMMI
jgi:hypothetical protein